MKIQEFKNKTILITGAFGLLGKTVTNHFFRKKAKLILVDKNLGKKLKKVDFYKCDFTEESERDVVFKKIQKKYKKIDVLINCAGYTGSIKDSNWITNFENQDLKNWKNAFEVNLNSIFHISKILRKNLAIRKGNIINIGSIYSILSPDPSLYKGLTMSSPAAYAASKGGLQQLTKWLAAHLAPKIRVNMISTIGIRNKQPIKFIKRYEKKIPLKMMCKEEDIIGVINLLASNQSKMITGQNIIIDGGFSLL
tara:strand:- start:772 stop:1527 length:756 start_codon:yes stop_codon:yes gene_type:complete